MQPRRYIVDKIDPNLVKCFSPLHQMLMFLGCTSISFKDHFVTTPNIYQKLYTLLCIVAFTSSFFYMETYYYKIYYIENSVMYLASVTGIIVQYLSYFTNIIYTRFWDNESAIKLFLMLNKVDNTLTLKEFQHMKEQQYYWNLIVLVLNIVMFEGGFIFHALLTVEYPILTVFAGMGILNVYVEIVFCASLIFYLAIRLRFLNKVIDDNFHVKCTVYFKGELSKPIIVNENLIITTDSNDINKLDLDKLLDCLKQILKSYKLITEVFSFPVLNITTTLFLWVLLITLSMIIGLSSDVMLTVLVIVIGLWFLYYFILLIMLALVSDYFIQEVRKAKLLCIHAMSCHLEGPIWKGASEILRTMQFYQPTFSVYGIFTMDKKLLLSLISLITTNLVMLIQFTIPNYGQK